MLKSFKESCPTYIEIIRKTLKTLKKENLAGEHLHKK